jgi:hypothetical protein
VFVEHNAGRHASQEPRQALLALAQRQRAEILPVQFKQIEGLQDRLADLPAPVERIDTATPLVPQTTASPSRVNDFASSFEAAAAIAG